MTWVNARVKDLIPILRHCCLQYKKNLIYMCLFIPIIFIILKVNTIVLTKICKSIQKQSPFPVHIPTFNHLPIASLVFFRHTYYMPTSWPLYLQFPCLEYSSPFYAHASAWPLSEHCLRVTLSLRTSLTFPPPTLKYYCIYFSQSLFPFALALSTWHTLYLLIYLFTIFLHSLEYEV